MTHGTDYVLIGLVAILGLLLFFLGWKQVHRLAGPGRDVAWACCYDFDVPITESSVRLMTRYLRRTDRYRKSWAWLGVVASIASAFAWRPLGHGGWGLVTFPPTSNVVLMALGFWFLGLVRSELYHLRPRYAGARSATLEVRGVHRYLPRRMVALPRLTALLAVVLVVTDRILAPASLHATTVLLLGGLVVVALVVTEAAQRGIALRSRPTVGPDLRAADEAIRRMASWSVAYGAGGLLALLAAIEAFLLAVQVPRYITHVLPGVGVSNAIATGALQSAPFVWLGIGLFLWSVGLAVQAGWMVRPGPRAMGWATAQLAR